MAFATTPQDPPQGPLRYLQLTPDGNERDFSLPQLNCSPLVIVFEIFSWHVLYRSLPVTGLGSAKGLLLYKWLPKKFSF
jgi:hypothetical protein